MSALNEYHYLWTLMAVIVGFIVVDSTLQKIQRIVDSIRSDIASKSQSDLLEIESHLANIDDKIEMHLSNIEDRLSEIGNGLNDRTGRLDVHAS
jgi:hypothetical protein